MERLELISPPFGDQSLEALVQKGDKTTVLFTSDHGEGRNALWKTVLEPFEAIKTEKIAGTDNTFGYRIVEAADKYFILFNGTINKLNLELNKVDPVNISYAFRRNLQEEFAQIFEEMWADVQENYYDETSKSFCAVIFCGSASSCDGAGVLLGATKPNFSRSTSALC